MCCQRLPLGVSNFNDCYVQGELAIGIVESMFDRRKEKRDEERNKEEEDVERKELIIVHGSKYKDDCSDDYAYLMLSNIILYMEDGR